MNDTTSIRHSPAETRATFTTVRKYAEWLAKADPAKFLVGLAESGLHGRPLEAGDVVDDIRGAADMLTSLADDLDEEVEAALEEEEEDE